MAPSLSELIATSVEEAGVEPSEMTELVLDGNKGWTMDPAGMKKLGELTGLAMIAMNDCDLKKLETFPETLTELVALELTDNKLSGADLKALVPCKKLEFLALAGNEKITMEDLKPFALRRRINECIASPPNFERLVLGCIETNLCK